MLDVVIAKKRRRRRNNRFTFIFLPVVLTWFIWIKLRTSYTVKFTISMRPGVLFFCLPLGFPVASTSQVRDFIVTCQFFWFCAKAILHKLSEYYSDPPDDQASSPPTYLPASSPATIGSGYVQEGYVQEQFGGGWYKDTPAELTPLGLQSTIKPTSRHWYCEGCCYSTSSSMRSQWPDY